MRELPLERGVGEIWPVEEGGDAGSAVCIALRMVEVRLTEVPLGASGDEVRRRTNDCSDGDGGEAALPDPPDGVRVCVRGTPEELVDRDMLLDVTRALGADGGEVDILRGDAGRTIELRGDVPGDPARF